MKSKNDVSLVGGDNEKALVAAKLTPQQKRFCEEYLQDLNQTAAAIRANYSPNSATEQASRLLTNTDVRMYIDIMMAERSKRVGVNNDRVVRELARIAFANPTQVVMEDGSISPDASEDDLAAIQSIKIKVTHSKSGVVTEKEVRFHDKNKSLELLMRHAGMLVDRKQVDIHKQTSNMPREELEKQIAEFERLRNENTINITAEGDSGNEKPND